MKKIIGVVILVLLSSTAFAFSDGVIKSGMSLKEVERYCVKIEEEEEKGKYRVFFNEEAENSFMFPATYPEAIRVDSKNRVVHFSQVYGEFTNYKEYTEAFFLLGIDIESVFGKALLVDIPNIPDFYIKSNRNPTLDVSKDVFKLFAIWVNDEETEMVMLNTIPTDSGVVVEKISISGDHVKEILTQGRKK